jgi:hypothetical protein
VVLFKRCQWAFFLSLVLWEGMSLFSFAMLKHEQGEKQTVCWKPNWKQLDWKYVTMVVQGHSAQTSPNFAQIITQTNCVEGAALELLPGLVRPRPCEAKLTSNTLSTFFFNWTFSQTFNVLWIYTGFCICVKVTHFLTDCFQNIAHQKAIYLLTGVRKHESNVFNNISQQNVILKTKTKSIPIFPMETKTSLTFFLALGCVFTYQSIVVFTNAVLWCVCFGHTQIFFSNVFSKQCWKKLEHLFKV